MIYVRLEPTAPIRLAERNHAHYPSRRRTVLKKRQLNDGLRIPAHMIRSTRELSEDVATYTYPQEEGRQNKYRWKNPRRASVRAETRTYGTDSPSRQKPRALSITPLHNLKNDGSMTDFQHTCFHPHGSHRKMFTRTLDTPNPWCVKCTCKHLPLTPVWIESCVLEVRH